jgi:hypothetical protein
MTVAAVMPVVVSTKKPPLLWGGLILEEYRQIIDSSVD